MPKHYDPIAEEEPHIVAEYHLKNCTALIADNYLRRLTPEQKEARRKMRAQAHERRRLEKHIQAAADARAEANQLRQQLEAERAKARNMASVTRRSSVPSARLIFGPAS